MSRLVDFWINVLLVVYHFKQPLAKYTRKIGTICSPCVFGWKMAIVCEPAAAAQFSHTDKLYLLLFAKRNHCWELWLSSLTTLGQL